MRNAFALVTLTTVLTHLGGQAMQLWQSLLRAGLVVWALGMAGVSGAVKAQPLPEEEVLLSAAKQGNLSLFRNMLQLGASAHARDADGANALVWAADSGSDEMLREVLLLRIDPNAVGVRGLGALSLLALQNRAGAVARLIDAGARVDVRNADGSTALHVAAQLGREAIVSMLLRAGARPQTVDAQQATPLHRAARAGHAGVVRLLLQHGAPTPAQVDRQVHAADRTDTTPLFAALLQRREAAALAILQHAPAAREQQYLGVSARQLAQYFEMRDIEAAYREGFSATPAALAVSGAN
jgi:ankyrin repeat protein